MTVVLSFSGCGSSGGGGGGATVPVRPASGPTNPTVSVNGMKSLSMAWDFVADADHYAISEDRDGTSNFRSVDGASNITTLTHSFEVPVHRLQWGSTQYTVLACNSDASVEQPSAPVTLEQSLSAAAIGYFKASNTGTFDLFGYSVSISGDGNTLAVGATGEDSSATGIGGSQGDNGTQDSGAVYVFIRSGSTWVQQAYIKASNTGTNIGGGDDFGGVVCLSADGNTLAVAAVGEQSSATGIDGDQSNNAYEKAGLGVVMKVSPPPELPQPCSVTSAASVITSVAVTLVSFLAVKICCSYVLESDCR